MNPDLIAYASGSLDESARSRLDDQLREDSALRDELAQVRRRLAPLLTADEIVPPSGLVANTIALIAEHQCRELPKAPRETSPAASPLDRPWWRRADAIAVAAIAVTVLAMLLPGLFALRVSSLQSDCANNLRSLWEGVSAYESAHHTLPDVTAVRPSVAGMVGPILREAGCLSTVAGCPADGQASLDLAMNDLVNLPQSEFERAAGRLVPGYAYSLGFREGDHLRGPTLSHPDIPAAQLPLIADAPNLAAALSNSANHSGRGQNVLYSDGHIAFKTVRTAGIPGDDIYLNQAQRVAAGLGLHDVVLGAGAAVP